MRFLLLHFQCDQESYWILSVVWCIANWCSTVFYLTYYFWNTSALWWLQLWQFAKISEYCSSHPWDFSQMDTSSKYWHYNHKTTYQNTVSNIQSVHFEPFWSLSKNFESCMSITISMVFLLMATTQTVSHIICHKMLVHVIYRIENKWPHPF